MASKVVDWLDERIGFRRLIHEFMTEPLPKRVGWSHVFGSGLLFLFVVQVATGIFLASNYSASPDHAYDSAQFIMHEVPLGKIIRGFHHWGASLMVILVVLHLLRVFIYAAYKRPRELTWISGVLLLILVLAYGFTGYLLPWDQKAYWATVVGTKIVETVPLIGKTLMKIMRGGEEVGIGTLLRFYSMHVFTLTAFTLLLVGLHVFLVRKHGIASPWVERDEQVPRVVPFFPYQFFKDAAFWLLLLILLIVLTVAVGVPLEGIANPLDTSYVPRPEWYFLPLFELLKLKIFFGPMEFVGAVVVPVVFILFLILLPFYDKNPSKHPRQRLIALSAAAMVLLITVGLGVKAQIETPAKVQWPKMAGKNWEGEKLFNLLRCADCHAIGSEKRKAGPNFVLGQNSRDKEWLTRFLVNPPAFYPNSKMPATELSQRQLEKLVSYVSNFKVDTFAPETQIVSAKACASCHWRQYEEWQNSFHARSISTPTFRAMFTIYNYNTGGKSPGYCLNCHAPSVRINKNIEELAQKILAGEEFDDEGINCVVCHAIESLEDVPDPHIASLQFDLNRFERHRKYQTRPMTELLHKAEVCSGCHDYNANDVNGPPCCTVNRDWKKTALAQKGINCQSCHTRDEMGLITEKDEPANHRMPGGRDADMLRKAVKMEVEGVRTKNGVRVTVAIQNLTGHSIPNG